MDIGTDLDTLLPIILDQMVDYINIENKKAGVLYEIKKISNSDKLRIVSIKSIFIEFIFLFIKIFCINFFEYKNL